MVPREEVAGSTTLGRGKLDHGEQADFYLSPVMSPAPSVREFGQTKFDDSRAHTPTQATNPSTHVRRLSKDLLAVLNQNLRSKRVYEKQKVFELPQIKQSQTPGVRKAQQMQKKRLPLSNCESGQHSPLGGHSPKNLSPTQMSGYSSPIERIPSREDLKRMKFISNEKLMPLITLNH